MDKSQDPFLLELLKAFKIEATELYQSILNELVELEKNPALPAAQPLIEAIFRELHTLKGAAMAVNQHEIRQLCQGMENVFHKAKQGALTLTSLHFEAFYQAAELLRFILSEVEISKTIVDANALSQMITRLDVFTRHQGPHETKDMPESHEIQGHFSISKTPNLQSQDTVRIATSKLRKLLHEAEEFISVKATFGFYIREIQKMQIRELYALGREMEQFHNSLSRSIDDLLLDIKTTLLFPFSTVLDIIPKIVRDLGKEYKKEINLTISGGEIGIDRRILEEINNPLIHLIRNCIDHGLESAKIRRHQGKPAAGILEVTVQQDAGRHVILTVRDDGNGIDREKVIQSAVKTGIISRESADRMTDDEAFLLIFRSGVSTSPFITDISGRGLGMAIVAEKVSKLGGSITIASAPGQGTTFTIKLPVTLSNFRGVLVQAYDQFFIIPTVSVEKAVRVLKNEIRSVQSKQFILVNKESIALIRLVDILGISVKKSNKKEVIPVLILTLGSNKIALGVDQVHGEQEVIVRGMGPQLVHVRNISGVTILGSGQIVPIINIPELMDSAVQISTDEAIFQIPDEFGDKKQKCILVAEDSITMRSFLRNIIESAGFIVKTAVDGIEAFKLMKNEVFDLVVTDIGMPRMTGIELTTQIRNDKSLSEIPVILVTALDSPDERKRGMESGANAYIVKGNFEQGNLIELIHRMI